MRNGNRNGFGFLSLLRGKAPKNIPGAERFSPDYDGPVPLGRKHPKRTQEKQQEFDEFFDEFDESDETQEDQ